MKKLFGTDGIRGVAYTEINKELIIKLSKALAYIYNNKDIKIIIGNDGRESSGMILDTLIKELTNNGICILDAGLIPTPGIAYLVKYYNYDLGIMISASHNSYEYNGIKIFDNNGHKISDKEELNIERLILDNIVYHSTKKGRVLARRDVIKDYGDFLLSSLNKYNSNINYNKLNIVIDTSNGASSIISEYVFSRLGCKYHIINNKPNGTNINNNCGSVHPEVLREYVLNNKLDLGIAYDGDSDRIILIDELGNIIDGDYILAIISKDLKGKNKLNNNTIVGTIMSNLGLIEYCKNNNIEFISTEVGDKYIEEYLNKYNLPLGGESSGHIILKEYQTTGDGLLISLIILSIIIKNNTSLSSLTKIINKYPEVSINIKVNNKNDFYNDAIEDKINKIKISLGDTYKVVVRPSGTEPLIRIKIEGRDTKILEKTASEIKDIIIKYTRR